MSNTTKSKQVHVVPSDSGWKVVRPKASRATGVYENKNDAVKRAQGLAQREGSSVVTHRKDGRITDVKSYGKKKWMKNRNVFINCPYDNDYRHLMHLLIYMVCKFSHKPQLAGMYADVDDRMTKILKMIQESEIGIHDISLMEFDGKNNLARFNMPFELGIDYAYKKYVNENSKLLIMEKEPYLSKKALSDLSGNDIVAHKNDPEEFIKSIRNFFIGLYSLKNIKYQAAIMNEYQTVFEYWLRDKLTSLGYPQKYLNMEISISEFVGFVEDFFKENTDLIVKVD